MDGMAMEREDGGMDRMDRHHLPPIGVISGVSGAEAQRCLDNFATRHHKVRVVGLVERTQAPASLRRDSRLVSLADGRTFPIFQQLGSAAKGCALLPAALIEATALVCRHIEQGCDVVVLSKYAKLEAEAGSGLVPAFAAAIEAGLPILTYVPDKFADAWHGFAAPLYARIPATSAAIDRWWAQSRGSADPLHMQGDSR